MRRHLQAARVPLGAGPPDQHARVLGVGRSSGCSWSAWAGTRWGLARHWWVLAKLILTLVAGTAAVLVLRPSLNQAAAALALPPAELAGAGIGQVGVRATTAPAVGALLLVTAVMLAVYKPEGPTRFRRR